MTVKQVKELEDMSYPPNFQKSNELMASDFAMDNGDLPRFTETKKHAPTEVDRRFSCESKGFTKLESDLASEGAAESLIKSSKPVGRVEYWTRNIAVVHHQILKIREEDSHLGEDIGEGLSTKEKLAILHLTSQMDTLIQSRPFLPSSPLSGKTVIRTIH